MNFILIIDENMNVKKIEQGNVAKLYFKLVLNKLKVMGGILLLFIHLKEFNSKKF
jgi:hypothetical protein